MQSFMLMKGDNEQKRVLAFARDLGKADRVRGFAAPI